MNENHNIEYIQKMKRKPILRTLNGCGFRLGGALPYPYINGTRVAVYWITLLFIPIIPLSAYVISGDFRGPYKFYGKISFANIYRIYGKKSLKLLFSSLFGAFFMISFFLIIISLALGIEYLLGFHSGFIRFRI